MRIGIIGAGHIGTTAAQLFIRAGHEVAISNSRGPETLKELIQKLGSRAQAATVEGAARFGDVVLVAIPFRGYSSLPADAFAGKIVIDAMNYYPQRDGHIRELDNDQTTSSELLAAHLPGARVVKAFNTIYYQHLATRGNTQTPLPERHAIFVAGDDEGAKQVVSGLIGEIGFAPIDTGSLKEGRRQQPGTSVYNRPMPGREAQRAINESRQ
jgi:8-hydroxy-5-deazaflavin:NADPH oxidoreductase